MISVVACSIAAIAAAAPASGRSSSFLRATGSFEPRELIVQFKSDVSARERKSVLREERARVGEELPLDDTFLVDLRKSNVPAAARSFERNPEVDYAEPNYLYELSAVPNDPDFPTQLWGLNNTGQTVNGVTGTADADIDAPEAWDLATGNKNVVVGIVDSGIDYNHPDLKDNIWQNPGETPGNGKDDDGNGQVDDVRGWDFGDGDGDPMDGHSHGTHVAGTVGAVGNNGIGVTGVAWNVSLMPIKVMKTGGVIPNSVISAGFAYAIENGAKVVNASLGGPHYAETMKRTIESGKNKTLFVIAAGNDNQDIDKTPDYPCSFKTENMVCVAATTANDTPAVFTNYGPKTVDIAAPGVHIYSTLPNAAYGFKSGTSMSAPHVTGAAALLNVFDTAVTPTQARQLIVTSLFDKLDSLAGKVSTSGRLGLPNTQPQPPPKPKPKPKPGEPEKPPPPPDQPTYPNPADPSAPAPDIDYLLPVVPGTTIIVINHFTIVDGYVGNVNQSFLKEVIVSLERSAGGFCWYLTDGAGMVENDCADPLYVTANGTNAWEYAMSKGQQARLKPGNYTVRVRIITTTGESLLVSTKQFKLSNKAPKKKKKKKRKRR